MRETFTLHYPKAQLEQLLSQKITIKQFMANLLSDTKSANHTKLCNGLAAYHTEQGGSPEVKEFEIVNARFDSQQLTGSFTTRFEVQFSFTCSGINSAKKDTITWEFKIDTRQQQINFTGEEPWQSDAEGY